MFCVVIPTHTNKGIFGIRGDGQVPAFGICVVFKENETQGNNSHSSLQKTQGCLISDRNYEEIRV